MNSLQLVNLASERTKTFYKLTTLYLNESVLKERNRLNSVSGTFFNFAKTFDWVNHQILLDIPSVMVSMSGGPGAKSQGGLR